MPKITDENVNATVLLFNEQLTQLVGLTWHKAHTPDPDTYFIMAECDNKPQYEAALGILGRMKANGVFDEGDITFNESKLKIRIVGYHKSKLTPCINQLKLELEEERRKEQDRQIQEYHQEVVAELGIIKNLAEQHHNQLEIMTNRIQEHHQVIAAQLMTIKALTEEHGDQLKSMANRIEANHQQQLERIGRELRRQIGGESSGESLSFKVWQEQQLKQQEEKLLAIQQRYQQEMLENLEKRETRETTNVERLLNELQEKILSEQTRAFESLHTQMDTHQETLLRYFQQMDALQQRQTSTLSELNQELNEMRAPSTEVTRPIEELKIIVTTAFDKVYSTQEEQGALIQAEKVSLQTEVLHWLEHQDETQSLNHRQLLDQITELYKNQQELLQFSECLSVMQKAASESSTQPATPLAHQLRSPNTTLFMQLMLDRLTRCFQLFYTVSTNDDVHMTGGKWNTTGEAVRMAGEFIPIPFAPLITELLAKGLEKTGERRQKTFAERMVNYFKKQEGSIRLNDELVERVAFQTANDYAFQLDKLDSADVINVAEYAAAILIGEAVSCARKGDYENKERVLLGSVRGKSNVVAGKKALKTPRGEEWNCHGLFARSGITVSEPPPISQYVLPEDTAVKKMFLRLGKPKKPRYEKYGFHVGTFEEATRAGFVLLKPRAEEIEIEEEEKKENSEEKDQKDLNDSAEQRHRDHSSHSSSSSAPEPTPGSIQSLRSHGIFRQGGVESAVNDSSESKTIEASDGIAHT